MYDIIGDVHGCAEELLNLLDDLGYTGKKGAHKDGRKAVFVGDLCDRGPYSANVILLVKRMVEGGNALMVQGNHDNKLMRWLKGNKVSITHGLDKTIESISIEGAANLESFKLMLHDFLAAQPFYLSLDMGALYVVHAAAPKNYQGIMETGKKRKAQKAFALYGVTTGKKDEHGFPERVDWAQEYDGNVIVVHGHVAQKEPTRVNNVVNVDTACVYGNKLTAFRYPEMEFVSVPAIQTYRYDPRLSP